MSKSTDWSAWIAPKLFETPRISRTGKPGAVSLLNGQSPHSDNNEFFKAHRRGSANISPIRSQINVPPPSKMSSICPRKHHKITNLLKYEGFYKIQGSIRESQAWSGAGRREACSWRWMPAENDGMEPTRTAVETLGGDAAEASREALDPAVAAVDRLDVHGPAHPLRRRAGDALARMPSAAAGRTAQVCAKVHGVLAAMEDEGVEARLGTLVERWCTDAFMEVRPDVIETPAAPSARYPRCCLPERLPHLRGDGDGSVATRGDLPVSHVHRLDRRRMQSVPQPAHRRHPA